MATRPVRLTRGKGRTIRPTGYGQHPLIRQLPHLPPGPRPAPRDYPASPTTAAGTTSTTGKKKAAAPYVYVPKTPQDFIRQQQGIIQTEGRRHQEYAQQSAQWLADRLTPIAQGADQNARDYQTYLRGVGQIAASGDQIEGNQPGTGASYGRALEVPAGIRSSLQAQSVGGTVSGLISNAQRYAQNLPSVYTKYAADYTSKLAQWALNFQNAREIAGLEADASVAKAQASGSGRSPGGAPAGTAPPPGYVAIPRSDGGVDIKPDRTYTKPGAAGKAPTPGGYGTMTAAQYRSQYNTWATRIEKMYQDGTGPEQLFDTAVKTGKLRPSDAMRVLLKYYDTVDATDRKDFLKWLGKYLPAKNAAAVLRGLGIDYSVTGTRNQPGNERTNRGR